MAFRRRRSAALLLAGVVLAVPATAENAQRHGSTVMPLASEGVRAAQRTGRVKIPYERFTLPNGLTVLVHTDHTVPTVFVGVWYKTGSKDEPTGKSGFAHLFEHLMFQQTANRKGEYLSLLQGAGATDMNGSTNLDYTNYYETVPTNALDFALWMESDRMGYLDGGITQAVLDEQRRVVENEKRQAELQPETRARERQLASLYPAGHPYAHTTIGSMQDLDAASLDDVKHWFVDHYGASNAVVVLAGDIDVGIAKAKMSRYFGAIRPGEPGSRPLQWVPEIPSVRRDVVYDHFGSASLTRTWQISNEDPRETTLLQLVARTMAGPKTSPLTRRLVDEQRIATGVSADLTENRLGSTFSISLTMRPGVLPDEAGRALDDALRDYLAAGPPAERLQAVVTASDLAILRSMESNAAVANWLVQGEVDHDDPAFFLKQRDWIADADQAEVRAVATKWLKRPYYQQDLVPMPVPTASAAVDVDRTRPPALGPIKTAIAFPPVTETMLSNGLRLVVAERHGLPVVDVSMQFATGTSADRAYAPGTAAAAFGLLTAGTGVLDSAGVAREASRLGANIGVAAGPRRSSVNWSSTVGSLDGSFALAASLLQRPLYPQTEIDRVSADVPRGLDAYEHDPLAASDALFARAVWGDADPRGHITGRGEAVRLSRDALLRFHDREIVPRGATLYMIGDVTPLQARAMAERHFGTWRAGPSTALADLRPPPPQHSRIILVDAPGAEQASISVGNLVPPFDKDRAAAEALVGTALSSGSTGRLNMNLREEKGWTYGFGGDISDDPDGDRLFVANGTVQSDKAAASMAEIRREITDFVSTRPMTEAELEVDRDAALRSIPLGLTSNGAFLASMISSSGHDLPYDRATGAAARVSSVSLDEARRVAASTYKPDDLVWVVVGDLKVIEPGIRALDIAPVEVWDVYGRKLR